MKGNGVVLEYFEQTIRREDCLLYHVPFTMNPKTVHVCGASQCVSKELAAGLNTGPVCT